MKYFIASKSIIKLLVLLLVFSWNQVQSQGKTHNFLIGYQNAAGTWTTHGKGRLLLNSNSIVVIGENRKMPFQETQANISDENGIIKLLVLLLVFSWNQVQSTFPPIPSISVFV